LAEVGCWVLLGFLWWVVDNGGCSCGYGGGFVLHFFVLQWIVATTVVVRRLWWVVVVSFCGEVLFFFNKLFILF